MRRLMVAAVVVGLVTTACGGSKQVGSDALGNVVGTGGAFGRFVTQTPTAKATASKSAAPKKTASPKAKPTVSDDEVSVVVEITSEGFDPYYIRVFVNGIIKVTNKDSAARSLTADDGSFDSGMLQPGKSWTYRATTPGRYNFHDETRPFYVGTIEVIAS